MHSNKANDHNSLNLKIVTYNIHKGMSMFDNKVVIGEIAQSLQILDADILCLQEVQGKNLKRNIRFESFPKSQNFWLADYLHLQHSYCQNSTYSYGHHGNAIFSKYPIHTVTNLDISVNSIEKRGVLHCQININNKIINILSVHLNLLEHDRRKQYKKIIHYFNQNIDIDSPLILAGDLNDWLQKSDRELGNKLEMKEVIQTSHNSFQPTFPAIYPILSLDRIYVRNINIKSAKICTGYPWSKLSDHLPVSSIIQI